ncbi:MAG: hypothetical protein NZV14_08005 [Bryobacteraceae bacterium]|nr:hypothetical protein [Bryobacteraceae bacterium]MDW8378090.1 hypothetical protein [Bryobacterales bacterium]
MEASNQNIPGDLKELIRQVIGEFVQNENSRLEPAYKAELMEERRRREQLERRVNELVEESQRSRQLAEEAERQAAIRAELQRHGVVKLDLAYRAVKEDVKRTPDGRLVAQGADGEVGLREYIARFVDENPEFLPARISGGSGSPSGGRTTLPGPTPFSADLEKIRPGMDREDLERIRQEVARVAMQTLSGR